MYFSSYKILAKRPNALKRHRSFPKSTKINSSRSLDETNAKLFVISKSRYCEKKKHGAIVIGKEAIKKTVGSIVDRLRSNYDGYLSIFVYF